MKLINVMLMLCVAVFTFNYNYFICQANSTGDKDLQYPFFVQNKIENLNPSGSFTYPSNVIGDFKIEVRVHGLMPNRLYALSLNGVKNCPGNNKLIKKCPANVYKGEGCCDIAYLKTDENGYSEGTFCTNLPAGDYSVKLLIKDTYQKNWIVVLKNDNVNFRIREPIATTLNVPDSVGATCIIEGKLANPNNFVFVCIHPMLTRTWWVQNIPAAIGTDGTWRTLCFFGGIDSYEVVAIVSSNEDLLKSGDTITAERMRKEYFSRYPISEVKITQRSK